MTFIVLPQHVYYIVEHFSYLHYIIVIVQSNILYPLITTRISSPCKIIRIHVAAMTTRET